ncbi:MAG: multiheme c-type cytochrome [Bythopirellula sp.]|nr:multiheme c-type cytochrome [Bythopirellula sp.]
MKRNSENWWESIWLAAAAVMGLSALVGVWHSRAQPVKPDTHHSNIQLASNDASHERIEQIEQALAQAGCPGWMVLASEGPQALGSEIVPLAFSKSAQQGVVSQPSADNDPNDLLDGVPDLLWEKDAPGEPLISEDPAAGGEESGEAESYTSDSEQPTELPSTDPEPPNPLPAVEEPTKTADTITPTPEVEPTQPVQLPPTGQEPLPVPASPFTPAPVPSELAPHSVKPSPNAATGPQDQRTYCEFVADSLYPSAFACAKCHEKLFEEWSISSHAYASISPMFHKFEQKIYDLSQGTVGYFCYRCHSPVGTSLGISRAAPIWDVPQVVREGVTCVACHRVNERFGKTNGERRIEPGDIFAPVYGSIGGSGIAETIARRQEFKVKTSPNEQGPGQDMHVAGCYFDQLSKPEFCVSCHQVAVQPGIKLEVVWEQYRASPACKKGISCQDCHMGRIPGVPSGYEVGSAALVNEKSVNERRKHANHIFYGPGYSIAHPGIFPHNKDALRWTTQDWLLFDFRAGWGTDEFEDLVEAGQIRIAFPPVWQEADDRYDAREIIDDNLKRLDAKKLSRRAVMENGSHIDGPFFDTPLTLGHDIKFHYVVSNTNEGHNMPSGSLGAQPQLWANVVLIGPRGQRLWESGYLDRWGDLADIHSEDVRNKRAPFDCQLFNLQTMFLITGAKGTDREFFLPVNVDFDQLPYLRPGAQPISVLNHPPFIRMEGRSLAPLGSRRAPYKIPAELLREPGCYRLTFRMRMRTEPMYFMRFCESTPEMMRTMQEWTLDFHESSFEFVIR